MGILLDCKDTKSYLPIGHTIGVITMHCIDAYLVWRKSRPQVLLKEKAIGKKTKPEAISNFEIRALLAPSSTKARRASARFHMSWLEAGANRANLCSEISEYRSLFQPEFFLTQSEHRRHGFIPADPFKHRLLRRPSMSAIKMPTGLCRNHRACPFLKAFNVECGGKHKWNDHSIYPIYGDNDSNNDTSTGGHSSMSIFIDISNCDYIGNIVCCMGFWILYLHR